MRKQISNVFAVTLFILLCAPVQLFAEGSEPEKNTSFDTLTLYWENDIFSGTDRDYTNGLKLSWSTPFLKNHEKSKLPEWSYSLLEMIPFAYDQNAEQAFSFSLGHNIFTPDDTSRSDLILDDRPYAGQMYLSFGVQNHYNNHQHSWELSLGMIGPDSHADDLQNWLHDQTGSDQAKGWHNQLANEPTLDITFETKWRLFRARITELTSFDLFNHFGGRLGNVAIYTNAGLEARYGINLDNDFGVCPIRGGCEIHSAFRNSHKPRNNIYLFAAADGRAVARDIFLDGNTFTDSHRVHKESLVGDLAVGFGFRIGRLTSTYSYIFRTRQFKEQNNSPDFGSITVALTY